MGSIHRISGARALVVVALVVLGSLTACAPTMSAPRQVASKPVAGCPVAATTTTQDTLAGRACDAIGHLPQSTQSAQAVRIAYDAQTASVTVTVTLGGAVPLTDQQISAAQELTKTLSLREQQAMWGSGVTLKDVKVMVFGPTQDEYANIIAQPYGSAVLDATTAASFAWANLSADDAWDRYDSVYLRPTFDVVDDVPVAP
ncbi:MAG TPA: hypothetical protein VFS83_16600 [Ktedonobacterales bacterium]|nr:hypothetical protein [Ktedonobacterales bacterium]